MMTAATRIVLSGPESSGKSTLAAALGAAFGLPVAMEYARVHLDAGMPSPQSPGALVDLARGHLAWQRRHVPDDAPCGIFDTDLVNYFIWADVAFGSVPEEITRWLAAERHHIHLLCEPDLPWRSDPYREFPGLEKRRALFDRHARELDARGNRVFIIRGQGPARLQAATQAITTIFA